MPCKADNRIWLPSSKSLSKILGINDPILLDFIEGMLEWDP